MIELHEVAFSYANMDHGSAIDGVTLELREGEYVGLLGANGSGKSTLALLLNGLIIPDSGEVRVDGDSTADPDSIWSIRARVAVIFQNPENQIVATTVEEDVAFGPENLGIPGDELRERVTGALGVLGIQDLSRREPHLLSGGQKQKVAMAGVLAMNPNYLVLDEPTSMLDPQAKAESLEAISSIARQRDMGVLHITHDAEEVLDADRILIMAEGKIIGDGPPRDIFWDRDLLREASVAAPDVVRLCSELLERGIPLREGIVGIDDLVADVERLKRQWSW